MEQQIKTIEQQSVQDRSDFDFLIESNYNQTELGIETMHRHQAEEPASYNAKFRKPREAMTAESEACKKPVAKIQEENMHLKCSIDFIRNEYVRQVTEQEVNMAQLVRENEDWRKSIKIVSRNKTLSFEKMEKFWKRKFQSWKRPCE